MIEYGFLLSGLLSFFAYVNCISAIGCTSVAPDCSGVLNVSAVSLMLALIIYEIKNK